MNTDFPRIITLLRKERNISQKQAATDLGVSQALLSHYEKGIRECGLDFLVKTADYYNVSCDYLLGRCAEPMGKAAKEAPAASGEDKDKLTEEQKMLLDSQKLIFSMVSEKDGGKLEKAVRSYLSLAVYRIFRVFFTLSSPAADGFTLSAMEMKKARAEAIAVSGEMQNTPITTNTLTGTYPEHASSLFNQVKQCEDEINAVQDKDE